MGSAQAINIANKSINVQSPTSFRDILVGENAFYKQSNYIRITKNEMAQKTLLPSSYISNTEYKIITLIKQILSIIIFPIGIYNLIHSLIGRVFFLPSSSNIYKNAANISRQNIELESNWKYKRITLEVDGYKIDAGIIGKENTFNNNKWVLASLGNGEIYEDQLHYDGELKAILSKTQANGIVFNYPGVGASTGSPNRKAMEKAYRVILAFLEDDKNGIGAKQIIGYGYSLGGGVQGDALKVHKLKKGIKYVFVKSKTFSNMSKLVTSLMKSRILGFLIKPIGWNMGSIESSKKLQASEITMQTANVETYELLNDSSKIKFDGIIHVDGSLAKELLEDPNCPKNNKLFIGMPEMHTDCLADPSFLAQKIDELLHKA